MEEGRRRLAAIVAADIAGYSRLMEADEEGVIQTMARLRADIVEPRLAQHHGRIANTAGDSFLIEFASAVDAVRASLDIQSDVARMNADVAEDRQLQFRIGINVGDVVAQGDDLLGDGVNVAARLEQSAPAGGICVSRSVRDQVLDRLPLGLEDLGEIEVKNIARPVHVFQVTGMDPSAESALGRSRRRRRLSMVGGVGLATVVAFGAAGAAYWAYRTDRPAPEPIAETAPAAAAPLSLAVLPFADRSDGGDQAYFAIGVAEDIGTELARFDGLTVTAPAAARRFHGPDVDPQAAARELGVSAALTGSVRRSGETIRVTARLVDANSGAQLWAERYDRSAADVFQVQDDISRQVAAALSARLGAVVAPPSPPRPRGRAPDIRAYDAYIQGRAKRIPPTPENLKAAMTLFEQAIEFDSIFAGGYAGASFVQSLTAYLPQPEMPPDVHIAEALRLAEAAVALDPQFGPAYGALGEALFRARRHAEAIEAIETAVRLAPNDSLMRAHYGRLLGFVGKPEDGAEQARQALRMSPDSPPPLFFLGENQRLAGEFEAAIATLEEHRERLGGRLVVQPSLQLTAAYAQAGRIDDARALAGEIQANIPGVTVAFADRVNPYLLPEDRDAFLIALRAAGLPEAE